MEIPCETWKSTGQIHIESDSRGEGKVALYNSRKYLETLIFVGVSFILTRMLNYLPQKYTKLTKMWLWLKRLYMGDLLRAIYIE